ncbi:MAG: tRNA (adenosine(37)-N6)-dimethylallyltransferase MiaA [Clostridia bacterium]|nr:tRNA (adenosine(37)-N6)-dimethylallyltransferase MiaA [Clostridia bacterium]
MKPILCALVGPTGSGKTDTALFLARELDAEIVSMDSMQIYRGMDIGTAKPTREQLCAVRHHMIDVAEPDELFTVSRYREMAMQAIDDILSRGKRVLLVGGTGLYLQALSYEMTLGENGADPELRRKLNDIAASEGGETRLHQMLAQSDPETAGRLHPHDTRRVVRALEILMTSGRAKSEQRDEAQREGPYRVLVYGLSLPRERMYARINERVDEMMKAGLIGEVEALLARGIEPRREGGAMQAIGYKEIVSALRGEITMERAVEMIKQGSRRYAKRQWTWFRHDVRTKWFDWTEYESRQALCAALLRQIREDLAGCERETERICGNRR